MGKTTIRKTSLAAFLIVTLLLNLTGGTLGALAQTTGPGLTGDSITSALMVVGASSTGLANQLPTSTASSSQWASILSNLQRGLQNGTTTPSASTSLIDSLLSGAIPPSTATSLSGLTGLGNTGSVGGLIRVLNGSGSTLSTLSTAQGALAAEKMIQAAIGGSGSSLTPAQTAQLAGAVATALPQVAQALGGQAGVVAAITALASIATGTLPPTTCVSDDCVINIRAHHDRIRTEITKANNKIKNETTSEFEKHRAWLLTTFWTQHILPALMLMAEQLTVTGMLQVEIIGTFFDAKHQLETQRLFQQMTAKAHKDYQPSEGMCTFGTVVRSLASSERMSNLAQVTFAQRMMQRQTRNGEVVSTQGKDSDLRSRLDTYISTYCDQADNSNTLSSLCSLKSAQKSASGSTTSTNPAPERRNIDVDYTRNIESRLTLDVDFTPTTGSAMTPDEQDVFALSANLFSHNIAPNISADRFGSKDGKVRQNVAEKYMDLRSILAKRSVAQNSFAALTAMRTAGAPESAPFTKAVIKELGVSDDQEIEKLLGKNPSYFAQMEILTKKIYQNPVFYTELYDKPVNIDRKAAALQAIGLMQDRDLYNSLLRSEAVLSVLLETMLQDEQEKVVNAMGNLKEGKK